MDSHPEDSTDTGEEEDKDAEAEKGEVPESNETEENLAEESKTTSEEPILKDFEDDPTLVSVSTTFSIIDQTENENIVDDEEEVALEMTEVAEVVEEKKLTDEEQFLIRQKLAFEKQQREIQEKIPYCQTFDVCNKERIEEKYKNDYLHKHVANYFRKKKVLHIFAKDVDKDIKRKYAKYLNELDALWKKVSEEQEKKQIEHQILKDKYSILNNESIKLFETLQEMETELSKEYVDVDSAKDAVKVTIIERLMKRQRIQLQTLEKVRLAYVKGKNMLQEQQDALDALDNLGPNLRLIDYEQLKMDKRNLADKLEEKEMELINNRERNQSSLQTLAHIREKIHALNADIVGMEETLESLQGDCEDSRVEVNSLKKYRDYMRNQIVKLKEESGLVTKRKLLYDMEKTVKSINMISKSVEKLKEEYFYKSKRVTQLRNLLTSVTKLQNMNEREKRIKQLLVRKPKSLFAPYE